MLFKDIILRVEMLRKNSFLRRPHFDIIPFLTLCLHDFIKKENLKTFAVHKIANVGEKILVIYLL